MSHEESLQISENTNAAIEIATGDYIAFADHDDELTPNALFECVKALNKNRDVKVLYSDEDKMSMDDINSSSRISNQTTIRSSVHSKLHLSFICC